MQQRVLTLAFATQAALSKLMLKNPPKVRERRLLGRMLPCKLRFFVNASAHKGRIMWNLDLGSYPMSHVPSANHVFQCLNQAWWLSCIHVNSLLNLKLL